MIILNEDGILLSLDMTEVRNKIIGKGWSGFLSNFNWSTSFVMLFNIGTVIIYYHYSNMRLNQMGNVARRRQTEINNVIQEIMRLNNLNLTYSANMINNSNPNVNESNNAHVADENQNNNDNINDPNNNNDPFNNNNNDDNENDINIENQNFEIINNNNNDNNDNNDNSERINDHSLNNENQLDEHNDSHENHSHRNLIEIDDVSVQNNENESLLQNNNNNLNVNDNNYNNGDENIITINNRATNRSFTLDLNKNLNEILEQLNANFNRNPNISDVRENLNINHNNQSTIEASSDRNLNPNALSDNLITLNNEDFINSSTDTNKISSSDENKDFVSKRNAIENHYELINSDDNANIQSNADDTLELNNIQDKVTEIKINNGIYQENILNDNNNNNLSKDGILNNNFNKSCANVIEITKKDNTKNLNKIEYEEGKK